MTKLFLLCIISVLICCSCSFAEQETQFAEFSNDDLIECFRFTVELMKVRGLSPYSSEYGVTVPAGRYTIGVDIPAGIYRLEFPDDDYDAGMIYIYIPGQDYPDSWYSVGKGVNVQVYGKIELKDGMIFDLQDTTATFYKYKGLFGETNE